MRWIALALVVAFLAPAAMALSIGDKAPPVAAEVWINGDAVNPAQPDGKTVYVVEFWATWCPPCRKSIPNLNQLNEQFKDKNVVIVGITDEPEQKVRDFAAKMQMQYRIAIDTNRATSTAYMDEASGIPHAFIVDTNGVIIWEGHPMAGLDEALPKILDGSYNVDAVKANLESDNELEEVLASGDIEKALEKVDEIIARDPKNFDLYQLKLGLLVQDEQLDKVKPLYRTIYDAANDSAENLNTLAWMAATSPFAMADLDIAWKAANRAMELSEGKESAIIDTLARVHYALGNLDQAIVIQKDAVAASKDPEEKTDMEATLAYYEAAKAVREQIAAEKKP